jgi:hypothetical protein
VVVEFSETSLLELLQEEDLAAQLEPAVVVVLALAVDSGTLGRDLAAGQELLFSRLSLLPTAPAAPLSALLLRRMPPLVS